MFFADKKYLNLCPLFQAQEKLGPVDMLVNCAGTSVTGKFEDIEVNSFEVSEHTFLFDHMIISYLTILTIGLHSCVCSLEHCYTWLVLALRISSVLQGLPLTSPPTISHSFFFCVEDF